MLRMAEETRAAVPMIVLESAIEGGDRAGVERVMTQAAADGARVVAAELEAHLLDVVDTAGRAAAKAVRAAGRVRHAKETVRISFKGKNPRARAWAAARSSTLITGVTEATKEAVRQVVAHAFDKGIPVREAARLIRPLVGLTARDALAVANLRAAILANPGKTVGAGNTRVRVPAGGADRDLLERATGRYATRLLNRRAENIARTETIAASNEGQRELWLQGVEQGLLDADEQREWSVTPDERLCPICEEMDGQLAGLDEFFETPDGDRVMGPPAHPSCRCATILSGKSRREAA